MDSPPSLGGHVKKHLCLHEKERKSLITKREKNKEKHEVFSDLQTAIRY